MLVRVAGDQDFQTIHALLKRSYPVLMKPAYAPDVLSAALPLMTQANPDLITSGSYYVAENGGVIVGCGGWTWTAPGTGAASEGLVPARHFAVDPEHMSNGVGRAIFERCRADALVAGATRIQSLSSLNAEPFYERMGLRRLNLTELPIGEGVGFPVVLMEGPLKVSKPRIPPSG